MLLNDDEWLFISFAGISSEGSLFSYAQPTPYQVKYMGEVEVVSNDWINEDDPQSVLKLIEMAQVCSEISKCIENTSFDIQISPRII